MKDQFLKQIDSYMVYVYNIAIRMLGAEDAEDAAQDAILKAYENMDSFRQEAKLSTWLYRITMNVCKDRIRAKREQISIEDIGDLEGGIDPEVEFEREEMRRSVQTALLKLPADYREIIVLRELLGYEYEEIAIETGIPLGTVKSRISRGRKLMRHYILEEYGAKGEKNAKGEKQERAGR